MSGWIDGPTRSYFARELFVSPSNAPAIDGIIFSLRDDVVWASWPGKHGYVELGPIDVVIYMMRDFLAQCEVAERLVHRNAAND